MTQDGILAKLYFAPQRGVAEQNQPISRGLMNQEAELVFKKKAIPRHDEGWPVLTLFG